MFRIHVVCGAVVFVCLGVSGLILVSSDGHIDGPVFWIAIAFAVVAVIAMFVGMIATATGAALKLGRSAGILPSQADIGSDARISALDGSLVPPPGAWFRTVSDGWEVGSTTRSASAAIILLPLFCFWVGVLSFLLVGPMQNDGQLRDDLFWPAAFLLFAGGGGLGIAFIMSIAGTMSVRVRRQRGTVFVGVGQIGWLRRFDPLLVNRVDEESGFVVPLMRVARLIVLRGRKATRFGSVISAERRDFVLRSLRQAFVTNASVGAGANQARIKDALPPPI